jgi:hypothetical protein
MIPSATSATDSKPTISPNSQQDANGGGGGSSAGIIGGIVGAIAVVGIAAFLVVRRKKKARQNLRARMSTKPDPFTMGYGNNDPPAQNFPPPSAYKTEAATAAAAAAAAAAATATATATATTTPATINKDLTPQTNVTATPPAIGSFVVIATYIPTLSDELEIETGDHIELLVEYDDGWCQGINVTKGHTRGVFPRHCIDYATVPSNHAPNPDFERSKRVSSMYQTSSK